MRSLSLVVLVGIIGGLLSYAEQSAKAECVLVTGATGSVGPALVQILNGNGLQVKAVARRAPHPGLLPENAEFFAGDVTQTQFLDSVTAGVSIIFHLASKYHSFDPPAASQAEYERINVEGTRCVIESAKRNAVERVVFFSSINVYGPCAGQLLDENSIPHPEGAYARTKLAAEKLVLEACQSDGRPLGVVLRLATVYGARLKGNYRRLLKALDQKRFIRIGAGGNRRALIHECDLARAALTAARHPAAAGQVFNVSDGENHSLEEILQAICAALGRKPPMLSLPAGPVRALVGTLEKVTGILGANSPLKLTLLDKYLEDVAVDATRIQQVLGFKPQFDLPSGWRDVIGKMRQRGEI